MTSPTSDIAAGETGNERKRQLAESLARYLNPDVFTDRRLSKRNREASHLGRKMAMKQSRAAIRFFSKPGNVDRLMRVIEEQVASPSQIGEGKDNG